MECLKGKLGQSFFPVAHDTRKKESKDVTHSTRVRKAYSSFIRSRKKNTSLPLGYILFFSWVLFSLSISVNIPILLSPFIFLLVVGLVGGHGKFAFYVGACFAP